LLRKLAEHEERARALLAERDALGNRVLLLEGEAVSVATERDRLGHELAETRAEAVRNATTAREQAELRVRLGEEHAATVAALTRRVSELERSLEAASLRIRELAALAAEPAAARDDLTRLRGVGPGLARLLHGAGVTKLAQIAAWTEADIAAIAPVLRARPDRIRKEDWVGNAQRLLRDG
jgi:NADH-quinone oxidoreductase subunit E